MKLTSILVCLVLLFACASANNGRQFTIWRPFKSAASNNIISYRPINTVTANQRDFSQVSSKYLFAPAISNCRSYQPFNATKVTDVPPNINRELYIKLAHLWKKLDASDNIPASQCYTVYIDVSSESGDLIVGLRTHRNDIVVDYKASDDFVGFRRYASVQANNNHGAFVMGKVNTTNGVMGTVNGQQDTLSIVSQDSANACVGGGCPNSIVKNYRIAIEVCNKTTIEIIPEMPLGLDRDNLNTLNRFAKSVASYDIDLRGTAEEKKEIDVAIFNGEGQVEFFALTAKVLPRTFTNAGNSDARNLYSIVMDGDDLNPANYDADYASVSGGSFINNVTAKGKGLNFDGKDPKVNPDMDFLKLVCYKVPANIEANEDYLFDFGIFAESSPIERSNYHSIAVGLKSGDRFIGFNRRGYVNNKLGDVITASANDIGLVNVTQTDQVLNRHPRDGSILRSNSTASFFNIKISVYGKSCPGQQPGVSVFAGTPDCPPYSYVWDTLGQVPFDWTSGNLEFCMYQQSRVLKTDCRSVQTEQQEVIPQSTTIHGLTSSIEKADFGCDGRDLSGVKNDLCGVCGGSNECVGCDGKPFSGLKMDGCGVCNGTNSTCCNQMCGLENNLWDWLLVPHIIDDVVERFTLLNEELETTCVLLGRYNNLCKKNPNIEQAFANVDLAKHIKENVQWKDSCLAGFSGCITAMNKNITNFVPIAF